MRLVNPLALFLLVLVPLLLYLRHRRQQPAVISYPTLQDLRRLPRSFAVWLHRALPVLRALALILCVVALARPQWGFETTEVRRQGIAIDMVVDISRSMAAQDLELEGEKRDRLEVVKEAFRQFVRGEGESAGGREGDLIGMVTFAKYADGVSPLTLDHDMLLSLLDQIEIVTQPEDNGTSIGEAVALGVERLRQSKTTSKVLILLTDGSNNAGLTEPVEAAQIAKALGIKVYTIGTGRHGTAPVAMRAHDGRKVIRRMQVSIDERTLRQIAHLTGGQYFRATDSEALKEIYSEIDRLEKTTTVAEHYQQYIDFFPAFLLSGLGLVLLEAVLVNTRLRTVP